MAESSDWILKIISGPHQGAEVTLRPGRTVVGSHSECDLVLHDVLVAPQHFALNLTADGLTVEPLEGRVFCNGKRVVSAKTAPQFAFVTAGTTHVVVGPANARWPLLSPADIPELEKDAPPPVDERATPEEKKDDAASEPGDKRAPKMPTPEQRKRALWLAGVGGVLLLVWLVLWFTWGRRPLALPQPTVRDRAERVLAAFPEGKSVQLEDQGGRLAATGYLETDSAQREISAALREETPEVAVRLWSTPRLLETARGFVKQSGLPVELSAGAAGEIVARGEVPTEAAWTKTKQLLQQEVPGLLALKDEVVARPNPSAPAPIPVVVSPAPATSKADAEAPAPLNGVSVAAIQELGDGQGWIRLSNGHVLFRGAQLADAGRVVEIRGDRALIEKGDTRYALVPGVSILEAQRTPATAPVAAATP